MGALRLHIDGIERLAGAHKEAVALGAAEADVGADLRQQDHADALAFGGENMDAVVAGARPSRQPAQMLPSMSARIPRPSRTLTWSSMSR